MFLEMQRMIEKKIGGLFFSGVIIINMDVQIFIVVSILIFVFFCVSYLMRFFFSHNRWHKKQMMLVILLTNTLLSLSLISNIKNPRQDSQTYTSNYQRNENEERERDRERAREKEYIYMCVENIS